MPCIAVTITVLMLSQTLLQKSGGGAPATHYNGRVRENEHPPAPVNLLSQRLQNSNDFVPSKEREERKRPLTVIRIMAMHQAYFEETAGAGVRVFVGSLQGLGQPRFHPETAVVCWVTIW